MHWFSFSIICFTDAVKDDEIEDWAAKKIQSSFKLYKHQKTLSKDLSIDGDVAAAAASADNEKTNWNELQAKV